MNAVLDALARACEAGPRTAEPGTAERGYLARPGSVPEAAAVLKVAAEHGLTVTARGAGALSALDRPAGRAEPADLVVDLGRLDQVLEHAAGDLVVRVQAGCRIGALGDALAGSGQCLALDVPVAGATVGGVLATGVSGPRRLLYGTARDLLIGITVIRADGEVARSGGKVVKNVAGYDLGKLFTGSRGTIGLIVEAAFRLHPIPAARAYVVAEAPDPGAAHARTQEILHSQLVPSAVEIDRPAPGGPSTLAVCLEGVPDGVAGRAERAARLIGGTVSDVPPGWWGVPPATPPVKIVAEIAELPRVLAEVPGPLRGSAGTGVLFAGPDAREVARALHPVHPGALALMRRIKDSFDPEHRLAPGRVPVGV